MKTDQELQRKFKSSLVDGNIINLVFFEEETNPEDSARLAELVKEAILKILNENPQKSYNGLIDIIALKEKVSYLASGIREIYAAIMSQKQIKNIAIVGANVFYETAIGFMIQAAGKSESIKWFSDKEEALKWLKK